MHANTKRKSTIAVTDISVRAILPKKKPVPHRHPAVARARMGTIRRRGRSLDSNCSKCPVGSGSALFVDNQLCNPQHLLNFFPLPQGQISLRPVAFLPESSCWAQ